MAKIESAFFDLSYLDALARRNTFIHRLDPRIKVAVAAIFIICVVSFDKYVISAMLPFALFLMLAAGLAEIPAGFLLKKLLIVSPFAVMVGIFNPLLDQQQMMQVGPVALSGGWLSFFSILLRFSLTVSAVLLLIASTGFNGVCMAMVKLGMPRIFAVQLLMLYRYIFVLIDEGVRMYQARALRTFKGRGMGMKTFSHLVGQLLLRTIDRAERIHLAMLCRGFDGTIRIRGTLMITRNDIFFLLASFSILILSRIYDLPLLFGRFVTGNFL